MCRVFYLARSQFLREAVLNRYHTNIYRHERLHIAVVDLSAHILYV